MAQRPDASVAASLPQQSIAIERVDLHLNASMRDLGDPLLPERLLQLLADAGQATDDFQHDRRSARAPVSSASAITIAIVPRRPQRNFGADIASITQFVGARVPQASHRRDARVGPAISGIAEARLSVLREALTLCARRGELP